MRNFDKRKEKKKKAKQILWDSVANERNKTQIEETNESRQSWEQQQQKVLKKKPITKSENTREHTQKANNNNEKESNHKQTERTHNKRRKR